MARIDIILFVLFIGLARISMAKINPITIFVDGADQVEIVKIENRKFSKNCLKKSGTCLALLKLNEKIIEDAGYERFQYHPASIFCRNAKGKNLILKNDKGQEYDFCKFEDNSMISSWDLYYAHHKK